MTRAYVLDPVTRDVLGLVDQSWERLSYKRKLWGVDTFQMSINRNRLWAGELVEGRLLYLPDEEARVFHIEQILSVAEGSTRNDLMTVSGRSLEGIALAERLVIPDAGQAYDKQTAVAAETAIKHYVTEHAASGAAAARQVPGLLVVATGGAGGNVTVQGRYQTVLDVAMEIGLLAGIGFEITYDAAGDDFLFDTIVGTNRSATVFFDFAFETLERWEELVSLVDSKTVALVAGQGEGELREIRTRWQGAEPTGFDRREAFIDARDVEIGSTAVLDARGDAFLGAAAPERHLEAGVHQYGSFRYREHWDLGDIVLVRNTERDLSYSARVVEVDVAFLASAAAPEVTAVLDRPFPTLKEQVHGSGPKGGAVDTAAPGVSDTVRISGTTELTLASTAHPFQIGPDGAANLAADTNEIQARNNGAAATLELNPHGGDLGVGGRAMSGVAPVRQVYTGGATWTKPAGLSHIEVETVGGGGAGGSANASTAGNASFGSGGAGGGYAKKLFLAAALPASCTVTVGAGGTAVAGGNGNAGGTSSFAGSGITTVQATGGGGGINGPNGATGLRRTGGSGGVGTGGDLNVGGGPGGEGIRSSSGVLANGGHGGDTHFGGGAQGTTNASGGTSTAGQPGKAYGGGGGGGLAQSGGAAALAGAGEDGVVVVTEYYLS